VHHPDATLRDIAMHEAGHAVTARLLGRGIELVTIVPDDDALGRVRHTHASLPPEALGRHARETWAMIALAGPLAEALERGGEVDTQDEELALALELTMSMSLSADEAVAYLVWLVERTRTLLMLHWGLVEYFADQLLEHRTVRAHEVHALIDAHI
jgi:ATP-dependent Zn protease